MASEQTVPIKAKIHDRRRIKLYAAFFDVEMYDIINLGQNALENACKERGIKIPEPSKEKPPK